MADVDPTAAAGPARAAPAVPDEEHPASAFWRRGDYAVVGDWYAEASRDVLVAADGEPLVTPGTRLLDVACGTGSVAIAAARAGAEVVGVDVTPEMLAVATERALAAGVECRFVTGSFEDLSGLGVHDVVTSAFGVMFADDPVAVAAQVAGATAPGGTVSVSAWHGDGAFGRPPLALFDLFPAPLPGTADGVVADAPVDTTRWADPEQVAAFFAGTGLVLAGARTSRVLIPFPSPAAAVDSMMANAAPWVATAEALAAAGKLDEGRAIMENHLAARSQTTSEGIAVHADYVVTQLER
jgi:SAM-dependent methyltransferase